MSVNKTKAIKEVLDISSWQELADVCSYWAKCKYPFFADKEQFLSNMNPSIHSALLSQAEASILLKTETVDYTRAVDYNIENISTRYIKFPGVSLPWIPESFTMSASWEVQCNSVQVQSECEKEKISPTMWTKALSCQRYFKVWWSFCHYEIEFQSQMNLKCTIFHYFALFVLWNVSGQKPDQHKIEIKQAKNKIW